MKEYKINKSEFHWKNNKEKFETIINDYSREGWGVVGFSAVGDIGNSFVAFIERPKHR
jgi:hypothetical protein